jgi:hypothetical protein
MGVLGSELFTTGDPAVVNRLDNCAKGAPTEATSHFMIGDRDRQAVLRLQQALKKAQANDPKLVLPPFSENGIYDKSFADAILAYKKARNIKNYRNEFDNVVGIKTIRALDDDVRHDRKDPEPFVDPEKPKVFPIPHGTCISDEDCPSQNAFTILLIVGGTGGEGAEAGKFIFMIMDIEHSLSAKYTLTVGGLGTPGLPFSPAGGGKPVPFRTAERTKITRFGPFGGVASFTFGPPGGSPIGPGVKNLIATLSFTFRGLGSRQVPAGQVILNNFDFGPFPPVAGGSFHAGLMSLDTKCLGVPGATRL